MADASVHGRILWYELLTNDMKAAEAFYTSVVGWSVTPFEGSPQAYDMWTRADGVPVGGVMTIPEGMNFPPHWGMYVGVPNLEDGVAKIERLGGSSMSPVIDVPTVGRMRTMKDPQGAMFSIYEPASPPRQPEAEPQVGDTSWHELCHDGRRGGDEVLHGSLRLEADRDYGHGTDGQVPHVRAEVSPRWHDEQACRHGAGPAELELVFPRS